MQFVFMIPHNYNAYKLIIHDKKRANSLKTAVIMNDSDSNTTTLLIITM